MKKEELKLAANLAFEYKKFLEGKGYTFEEDVTLLAKKVRIDLVDYLPLSHKFRIEISNPFIIIHEMTHIVLQKDGIHSRKHAYSFPGKELPEYVKDYYGTVLIAGVPDYYIDQILLSFLNELPEGSLKEGIKGYFKHKLELFSKFNNEVIPYITKELAGKLDMDSERFLTFTSFNIIYLLYSNYRLGWFKPGFKFKDIIASLEGSNLKPRDFFKKNCGLIRDFVDSLPPYGTLKKECGMAEKPYPTAKLSVRLFNILYWGLDIEHITKAIENKRILEFSLHLRRLIRENKTEALIELGKQYGVQIKKDDLAFEEKKKAVERTLIDRKIYFENKLKYDRFVVRCDGYITQYSVPLGWQNDHN